MPPEQLMKLFAKAIAPIFVCATVAAMAKPEKRICGSRADHSGTNHSSPSRSTFWDWSGGWLGKVYSKRLVQSCKMEI